MRELRLLPAALLAWVVVFSVILTRGMVVAMVLVGAVAVVALILRQSGQAVTTAAVGMATTAAARMRVGQAERFVFPDPLTGTVGSFKQLEGDLAILRLEVEGYPALVPVLLRGDHEVPHSAQVVVEGHLKDSDRPGVGTVLVTADHLEVVGEATGYAGWVNQVRDAFQESVLATVGPSSQGLLPGMVLGDTRLQDTVEEQTYIDTGLSHLSAVSGSNVSITTTSVMVVLALLTIGPRIQLAGAAFALVVFVSLVGTEPSVLRAAVTGMVGLLAVVNSRRMEPVHGLCLAVIGLLLWDPDLAVQYGFILSVVATAGIVMLFPLLYRALARTGWPDILVRAVAVAVAADVVTMPVIAVMAGQVSIVAVLANVLVAPAVAPVTVVGLVAVLLTLAPGGLEMLALRICEPFTWWIHQVGSVCQELPISTVGTGGGLLGTLWVLTACCWIIVGIHRGLAAVMAALFTVLLVSHWYGGRLPPRVDPVDVGYVVVDKLPGTVPPGTGLIIVTDPDGTPADRPTATREGIPVMYPNRDGEVTLHTDGSQHAADGRF